MGRRGFWRISIIAVIVLVAAGAIALERAFPPDLSRLQSVGSEVLDRDGRLLAVLPASGGVWRFAATTDEISPAFLDLLVRVEDRRFWWHPGVDPIGLVRAAWQWLRAGHIVSGGSTLAMQAARLLEPRPRTLRSKLIEIARALQLEAHFGREGVLGIWLTLAPYGGNLEGVKAGSLAWFGVPPAALDPARAALLVAIPRRPEALRPDRHPEPARALRDRVLAAGGNGFDATSDRQTPVPTRRLPLPRHAPQVVATLSRAPIIRTTLDLKLQTAVELLAAEHVEKLAPRASLALLIAEAGSRHIRAIYAGDWRSGDRAGSLDLTLALRSPGSALKPFIYADAFAEGLAGPETVIADVPRRFGLYAPENFDRGFSGSVTATEALRRSLNLPAVALLDRLGPLRFAATLRAAGFPLAEPHGGDPALPLALGGAGVSLRQAAAMYAALATDGAAQPLALLVGAEAAPRPFLPEEAARAVAEMLTRPFPAGGPEGIAWKTGTSWGGRDAWALGFDARYVAAAWVGRPDGTPLPGATGASLALPLLARLFELLPAMPRATEPAPAASAPQATAAGTPTDALRLLFPPPGAVLAEGGRVTIRAMGGRRPLAFLVDGAPIAAESAHREAAWTPPGPGFYRLTVLDADGAATHAAVQVR